MMSDLVLGTMKVTDLYDNDEDIPVNGGVVKRLHRYSCLEDVIAYLYSIGQTSKRLWELPSVNAVDDMDDGDIAYIMENAKVISEISELVVRLDKYRIEGKAVLIKNKGMEKLEDFDDPNVMLAVRMAGHDLNGIVATPFAYYGMLKRNIMGVEYNRKWVRNMLNKVPTIRAFAASLAFFGTRNPSFLYNVAGSEVESIVAERQDIMAKVPCNIYYDTSKVESVPVALCHIVSQLIRNSKQNYLTHHSHPTKCTEPYRIWVKIEELDDNYLISVRDNGTGFLDAEGTPIPAEKLGKVLDPKYTTGGTGLGLGVLPGYFELLKGAVQIVTTNTKTGDSKYYGTIENDVGRSIPRQMPNGQNGTEITFIMDKQKFREWNLVQ
jgi:hypothetical protein